MRDVKKYSVFQLADRLVMEVYELTRAFPREERFGLISQMRRAACSVPINLVEGAARAGGREFANFINIALGSCEEVRYELHLASALGYVRPDVQQKLDPNYEEVKRMLSKLYAVVTGRSPAAGASPNQESGL